MAQQDAAIALGIAPQLDPLPQIERLNESWIACQQQAIVILQHLGPLAGAGTGEAIGSHRLVEQLGIAGGQRPERGGLKQTEDPVQRLAIKQAAQYKLAAVEGLAGTSLRIEVTGHLFCAIALLPG